MQQVAIRQTGERIVQRLMRQRLLGLFALGDVLQHGDGAGKLAPLIELGAARIQRPQLLPVKT